MSWVDDEATESGSNTKHAEESNQIIKHLNDCFKIMQSTFYVKSRAWNDVHLMIKEDISVLGAEIAKPVNRNIN